MALDSSLECVGSDMGDRDPSDVEMGGLTWVEDWIRESQDESFDPRHEDAIYGMEVAEILLRVLDDSRTPNDVRERADCGLRELHRRRAL